MLKWYEQAENQKDVFVSSRVRLVRNRKGTCFPGKLSRQEAESLREDMAKKLSPYLNPEEYTYYEMEKLSETERKSLRERRIVNSAIAGREAPMGLYLSETEEKSVLLCGDDHIRMQHIKAGAALSQAWEELDKMDDKANEKIAYAFDEKYGYLTAFPTNVGTGLRATMLLHLPVLSAGKQFRKLSSEMNRFGIVIRGVYGDPGENWGALYEVSNQKTLGLSEGEIIGTVQRMAGQLAGQERKLRLQLIKERKGEREDEAFKSYGILRYARRLTLKEGMNYLSCIRAGINDGLLHMEEPVSIYGLMLGIQPANLELYLGEKQEEESLNRTRAEYVRAHLPKLQ